MFKILLSKLVLLKLLMLRMPCFALEAWAYFIEQARQLSLDNCCLEYVDKLIYSSLPFQISLYFLINDNNGNKITISLLLSITNFGQNFEPLMQFVDIYNAEDHIPFLDESQEEHQPQLMQSSPHQYSFQILAADMV